MSFDPIYFKWDGRPGLVMHPVTFKPRCYIYETDCCPLCERSGLSFEGWMQHQKESEHLKRVDKINKLIEAQSGLLRRMRATKFYKTRVASLSYKIWHNEIQAGFLSYLMQDSSSTLQLRRTIQKLKRYEHLERISILEQHVWRLTTRHFT